MNYTRRLSERIQELTTISTTLSNTFNTEINRLVRQYMSGQHNMNNYTFNIQLQNILTNFLSSDVVRMPMQMSMPTHIPESLFLPTFNNLFTQPRRAHRVLTRSEINILLDNKLSYNDLITRFTTIDTDQSCCVCLDNLKQPNANDDEKQFSVLQCSHIFHTKCITNYLRNYNHKCPLCNRTCSTTQ